MSVSGSLRTALQINAAASTPDKITSQYNCCRSLTDCNSCHLTSIYIYECQPAQSFSALLAIYLHACIIAPRLHSSVKRVEPQESTPTSRAPAPVCEFKSSSAICHLLAPIDSPSSCAVVCFHPDPLSLVSATVFMPRGKLCGHR